MRYFVTILLSLLLTHHAQASGDKFDTTKIELLRLYPEPFHENLKFEFKVHDGKNHDVKIAIANSTGEKVFYEKVSVGEGNETVVVNTIDFHHTGLYSIQIKIDNRYHYKRSTKRE